MQKKSIEEIKRMDLNIHARYCIVETNLTMKRFFIFSLLLFLSSETFVQSSNTLFDDGWLFFKGGAQGAERTD